MVKNAAQGPIGDMVKEAATKGPLGDMLKNVDFNPDAEKMQEYIETMNKGKEMINQVSGMFSGMFQS